MANMHQYLKAMIEKGASDFISPRVRRRSFGSMASFTR